jgi:hypothetical protein
MTRTILASLAAFTVLTFGGVTGTMAQQSNPCAAKNPCAVKPMQNPCAAKSQPAQTKSEKAWEDALRAVGAGKTASELAKEIADQPSF